MDTSLSSLSRYSIIMLLALPLVKLIMSVRFMLYVAENESYLHVWAWFLFLSIGLGPHVFPNNLHITMKTISVFYLFFLTSILFQNYGGVQALLKIDPYLYSTGSKLNCSFTAENLYSRLDSFIPARFGEWVFKTLLFRHRGILWIISAMWAYTLLLMHSYKCWWDVVLYDMLLCNGCGLFVGMMLCRIQSHNGMVYYWQDKESHSPVHPGRALAQPRAQIGDVYAGLDLPYYRAQHFPVKPNL